MLAPSGSDVHAWVVRLGGGDFDHAAAISLLSVDERDRLRRFRSQLYAERYALAHAFVRALLASYLDEDPRVLAFERGSAGKPRLVEDRSLSFNLSHSGDVVAVAVTRAGEVGIDIEIARDVPDAEAMARLLMSEAELASFQLVPAAARSRVFLEWWTRREAMAKATGVGIAYLARSDAPAGLTVERLETWEDCVAAIALAEPRVDMRVRSFDGEPLIGQFQRRRVQKTSVPQTAPGFLSSTGVREGLA